MSQRVRWVAAIAVLLMLVLAWWLSHRDPVATEQPLSRSTTSDGTARKPHFPSRSVGTAPRSTDGTQVRSAHDAMRLAYSEGVLITCSAPDLADGPYRVVGWTLRHLRATDGQLVGVLTKPSEGTGFLVTQRGHLVAEFQWSEGGCRVAPLQRLMLPGTVIDAQGEPVADVQVRGCVGDLTKSGEDGSFSIPIHSGQTCWPFTFREDEDGFAKGPMVDVVGGETQHLDLLVPGASMSASKQRDHLRQGATQLLGLLEREQAYSPVAEALEQHPDNPTLQDWSDEEISSLNLRYEDIEYLLSGDANDEDWRDLWLFGIGM